LIDFQNEMFETINSETDVEVVELNARLLAKTARAAGMPIVLTTLGVEAGLRGPTIASILSELDGVPVIDRSLLGTFKDPAFRHAVVATGRQRLIVAGLHTETSLLFTVIEALTFGHDVLFVADAIGGRSEVAHTLGILRMVLAGAVPTSALSLTSELFLNGVETSADPAGAFVSWYLAEVAK
jgi:nicotinamidase-related amidase